MKRELTFNTPFCCLAGTNFINCFASTYVFLENAPAEKQDAYFCLFDTMCGRSALRCRYDGTPTEMQQRIGETDEDSCGTDDTVDFLFGFAGYDYRKLTDLASYRDEVTAAINAGKPVIAKVNTGGNRFRVITGYDGDTLVCPDFAGAHNRPEHAPAYDELEALYIIGNKIKPRYTLRDGLERIQTVMEYNIRENLWGGYTAKLWGYEPDGFWNATLEEKKARMGRVAAAMWHTFNCHNFREVLCQRLSSAELPDSARELLDPAFVRMRETVDNGYIDGSYNYTHDLAWGLIGIQQSTTYSSHAQCYTNITAWVTIEQIARNDARVLECIKETLETLRKKDCGH